MATVRGTVRKPNRTRKRIALKNFQTHVFFFALSDSTTPLYKKDSTALLLLRI